ncbi:MAG: pseudouridine synthase [Candidatus Puniceispirillales bacterium WSBS_2018_MAG_OTU23]
MKNKPKKHFDKAADKTKAERSQALAALFHGDTKPERIAKKIARAGLCSRRDAERWVEDGRVNVNGTVLLSPALNVNVGDIITVDGKSLAEQDSPRLWRYYKPRGLVVSHRDEKDRMTVFDAMPDTMPRVVSVGRLDLDSEGLLLMTNSGDLARYLELPDTGWTRKYRVRVRGRVQPEKLTALADGITIDGVHYRGILAQLDRQVSSNAWLTIALKEGKNREIRKVMEHLGYGVSRLIRVSYGPFNLTSLEENDIEEIKTPILRDQLGLPRLSPAPESPTPKNTNNRRQ